MFLEETKEVYSQQPDSCSDESLVHTLTVDAGGGPYVVLKTTRWALDEEELPGFVRALRRTLRRVRKEHERRDVEEAKREHTAGVRPD